MRRYKNWFQDTMDGVLHSEALIGPTWFTDSLRDLAQDHQFAMFGIQLEHELRGIRKSRTGYRRRPA